MARTRRGMIAGALLLAVWAACSSPRSSVDRESAWDDVTDPPVKLLRRVGTRAEG